MESPNKCRVNSGFTLVELSIVMIIIGLLIGGIFSGMKLVDNANVQKTVQDIKGIESATVSFKDIYRALPGDIRNPSTRMPSCNAAACSTGGDGNRTIGTRSNSSVWEVINTTHERFTFWQHLQASELINLGIQNVGSLVYGEGMPESPVGGGYYITFYEGALGNYPSNFYFPNNHILVINGDTTPDPNSDGATFASVSCSNISAIDRKIDDGFPFSGTVISVFCYQNLTSNLYPLSGVGGIYYDIKF